jgi:hypothetical protein
MILYTHTAGLVYIVTSHCWCLCTLKYNKLDRRNNEARSCKHCSHGKEMRVVHTSACVGVGARGRECVCARVALLIQHVTHRNNVTCGLSAIFFDIILLNLKCVFWFSLQLLFETFHIQRRIQRDIVINVKTSSCKISIILFRFLMKLEFSEQIFESSHIKLIKIRPVGDREVPCGRTDRHDEANSRFSKFCERA